MPLQIAGTLRKTLVDLPSDTQILTVLLLRSAMEFLYQIEIAFGMLRRSVAWRMSGNTCTGY